MASHVTSLLIWGNNFGPSSSRAFLDTLTAAAAASGGGATLPLGDAVSVGGLVIDIKPYEADGRAQVAMLEVA